MWFKWLVSYLEQATFLLPDVDKLLVKMNKKSIEIHQISLFIGNL